MMEWFVTALFIWCFFTLILCLLGISVAVGALLWDLLKMVYRG
jgi:hypothetical protein